MNNRKALKNQGLRFRKAIKTVWGGGKTRTRTIRNGSADIQTARGRKRDHADSAMHFSMGIFRSWMGEIRGLL